MSAADERARAMRTATTDFAKALLQAEDISDAWYRCQSLAAVARYAPEEQIIRVATKALAAAAEAGDAYKRVAAAAWPVRALAERGKVQSAERLIPSLLEGTAQIEHPVSKMIALGFLWHATFPLPPRVKQPILDTLLSACQVTNSWKAGRMMRDVALVVASEDRPQAIRIVNSMRESIYKRHAQKGMEADEIQTVCWRFPIPRFDTRCE